MYKSTAPSLYLTKNVFLEMVFRCFEVQARIFEDSKQMHFTNQQIAFKRSAVTSAKLQEDKMRPRWRALETHVLENDGTTNYKVHLKFNGKTMALVAKFTFNPFQENTYIVYDETKECIIFDPGMYTEVERKHFSDFIESAGLKPVRLINTHCHLDHVFGTPALTLDHTYEMNHNLAL